MRVASIPLAFAVLMIPPCASAATDEAVTIGAAGRVRHCEGRLLDPAGWREAPGQAWHLAVQRSEGPGFLVYFGAQHTTASDDPQYALIEAAFEKSGPSIAFYEGNGSGFATTSAETVRAYGEPGFLRYLADRADVPTRSLEMDDAELTRSLADQFPVEQIQLFYALRTAVQLRDRYRRSEAAIEAGVERDLLRRRAIGDRVGLKLPVGSVAEIQAAFERYWPGRDWKTASSDWFNPLLSDADTGGVFTNSLNAAENRLRNRHMYEVLVEATLSGERVFAVVGRNHVPLQAAALTCAITGAE